MKTTLKYLSVFIKNRKDEHLLESLMILNVYFRSPMNQTEIAEVVGMTQQAISLIVRGERRLPAYKMYLALASNIILGVILENYLKWKFVKTYGEEGKLCYQRKRPVEQEQ